MDHQTANGTPHGENVFLIINQQITPLTKLVTRLGRYLDNDIVFNEDYISRHHAEIRCEDGKYIIHDQESASGTFVNNRRIERCVLNSGDLISLANVQIMFVNNSPRIADHSARATRSLPPFPERREIK